MRRLAPLLAPPVLWLAAFVVVPAAFVAGAAFSEEGLDYLKRPQTWALLGRSGLYAAVTTVLCLLLGYPAAVFIAGCGARARGLLLFLVVVPFWTNLLVRTYALLTMLWWVGAHHTPAAVLVGLVHSFLPFMILPLVASLEKVPPRLVEAARDLGETAWGAFLRVTVPLSAPGIAAGCLLVFVPALGIFALPEYLGGASVVLAGMQINLLFTQEPRSPQGAALTLVLMALAAAGTFVHARLKKSEGLV
jgi:spermidine/putrescine transport system permease protein